MQDEKALKALLAWWEDAGIPLDEPIVRPRAPLTPKAAPAQTGARETGASERRPAAATAASAKAAGFGDAGNEGPSARELAGKADTLDALRTAIEGFHGCPLRNTARNTVFARGNPAAKIMMIGEAPGRDEDMEGQPFVGPAGHLLDRIFASIGLAPDQLYLTNVINWRPPGNRSPTQDEIATCLPFIERHIALIKPDILVLGGGIAAQSLLGASESITKLRGQWADYRLRDAAGEPTGTTIPALPTFHPAYLLRRPTEKRFVWQDMLMLAKRLEG
ncbi:uracil-DNA glycosylase [Maricaulis salignorans]|uniref:Type-4 uracil-DNA glycosylase n=1 Tax=Maricaulis salignorans TaxID=144026 RepID=A0A1G9RK06_9PROT|nr:uracil-DNA glycosylase [Maricaulis salignorans]SDM23659.1 DNA polymerase [Maricaulis salignorans]